MKIIKIIKEVGRNAHIDWIAILVLSIGTALALAIGGLYLYNAVVKGDIQGSTPVPAISFKKFNEKAVSSTVGEFNQREEISKTARAGYAGVSDPSI